MKKLIVMLTLVSSTSHANSEPFCLANVEAAAIEFTATEYELNANEVRFMSSKLYDNIQSFGDEEFLIDVTTAIGSDLNKLQVEVSGIDDCSIQGVDFK